MGALFFSYQDSINSGKFHYPTLTSSKTPRLKIFEFTKKLDKGSTARKGPIGSTNHQWEKLPRMEVSLNVTFFYKIRQIR